MHVARILLVSVPDPNQPQHRYTRWIKGLETRLIYKVLAGFWTSWQRTAAGNWV